MEEYLRLDFNPIEKDLSKIEQWLFEESKKSNLGFYHSISLVRKAFEDQRIVIVFLKDITIAFLVWRKNFYFVEIDILEVHPDYRNIGIGKYIINNISSFFRKQGIILIKLSSSHAAEIFWRNLGFVQFPDRGFSESELTFYKPLIEVERLVDEVSNRNDTIELWDLEPNAIKNEKSKWKWKIQIVSGKLLKPVLQPCNSNWNLRWSKNGKVMIENRVKNFHQLNNPIEYSPFLFIEKLVD